MRPQAIESEKMVQRRALSKAALTLLAAPRPAEAPALSRQAQAMLILHCLGASAGGEASKGPHSHATQVPCKAVVFRHSRDGISIARERAPGKEPQKRSEFETAEADPSVKGRGPFKGVNRVILGLFWDNGKEAGNYYLGFRV